MCVVKRRCRDITSGYACLMMKKSILQKICFSLITVVEYGITDLSKKTAMTSTQQNTIQRIEVSVVRSGVQGVQAHPQKF